jgi:hypothetical protein
MTAEPLLPDLRAGYGHDANHDGRQVVIYVGLQLDGAHPGARLAVRDVLDFFAVVNRETGQTVDYPFPTPHCPRRFTYLGPTWKGPELPAHLRDDAPHQRCDGCGRKTWATEDFGGICGMTQPAGWTCRGTFRSTS